MVFLRLCPVNEDADRFIAALKALTDAYGGNVRASRVEVQFRDGTRRAEWQMDWHADNLPARLHPDPQTGCCPLGAVTWAAVDPLAAVLALHALIALNRRTDFEHDMDMALRPAGLDAGAGAR